MRYVVTVGNEGRGAATNVRICDALSGRVSIVRRGAATLTGGRRLCWRVPELAPGRTVRRALVVRVDRAAPDGRRIVNRASADSEQIRGLEARARRTVRVVGVAPERIAGGVTG